MLPSIPKKYLSYLFPMFGTARTKQILHVNPTIPKQTTELAVTNIQVFEYNQSQVLQHHFNNVSHCSNFITSPNNFWINVDGIKKSDVELLSKHFNIHPLITEDVLSQGQRPKFDEMPNHLSCLLNMLYFNSKSITVDTEQVTLILGKNFVISFQEDAGRDVFNPIREKLLIEGSKLRLNKVDYLCYALLDMIVDNYFLVMENLSLAIESTEEEVIRTSNTKTLAKITALRKEMIVLKRNVAPLRELVNGFLRTDSNLLKDDTIKYYKDVYDHLVQANDLCENYRDMIIGLQDLYLNQTNLKMNEVMKVMAIVTCLLAPATVIGGVFGMNFENIPLAHNQVGFYISVFAMLIIPIIMLIAFKRRGWF
jgi:magnesium transporter